jgi:hypothetical protein
VEMAKESEFQTETQFLDHLSVQVISRIYFASARLDLHVPGDVHNKHFRQSSQLRACRRPTYSWKVECKTHKHIYIQSSNKL